MTRMTQRPLFAVLMAAAFVAGALSADAKPRRKKGTARGEKAIEGLQKEAGGDAQPHLRDNKLHPDVALLRAHDPQFRDRCGESIPIPPADVPEQHLKTAIEGKTRRQAELGIETLSDKLVECRAREEKRKKARDCLDHPERCKEQKAARRDLETIEKHCADWDKDAVKAEKHDLAFLNALKYKLEWVDYCRCCFNQPHGSICRKRGDAVCPKLKRD